MKKNEFPVMTVILAAVIIFSGGFGLGYLVYTNCGPRPIDKPPVPVATVIPEKKSGTNDIAFATPEPVEPAPVSDFQKTVDSLDSSEKLLAYLKENFAITADEKDQASKPEDFFSNKKGGPQDVSVFIAYVLRAHSYEAGVIRYNWTKDNRHGTHTVAIFRDKDLPKYITTGDGGLQMTAHGWSFEDLLKKEAAV